MHSCWLIKHFSPITETQIVCLLFLFWKLSKIPAKCSLRIKIWGRKKSHLVVLLLLLPMEHHECPWYIMVRESCSLILQIVTQDLQHELISLESRDAPCSKHNSRYKSVIASTFGFYLDLQNGKQTRRQEKPACIPYCIGRTYAWVYAYTHSHTSFTL